MGSLSCSADLVISWMLQAFEALLLVRVLLSWVPSLNGRWANVVFRITEPVIAPVQRIIPPIGGFSIAFIVVFYLAQLASGFFAHQAYICKFGIGG